MESESSNFFKVAIAIRAADANDKIDKNKSILWEKVINCKKHLKELRQWPGYRI